MMFSKKANSIFKNAIIDYKKMNQLEAVCINPLDKNKDLIGFLLYEKCWIDAVQWAYEDVIRDPNINPNDALILKRKIDASNQKRTDTVEFIDSYFLDFYKNVTPKVSAKINSESPAWAIDRLSILALKIYHMQLEVDRTDVSGEYNQKCTQKLAVLLEQQIDLSTAIDDLLQDIANGDKYMKVYKQMKMYNDEEMNPVLRASKQQKSE